MIAYYKANAHIAGPGVAGSKSIELPSSTSTGPSGLRRQFQDTELLNYAHRSLADQYQDMYYLNGTDILQYNVDVPQTIKEKCGCKKST